MPEQRTYEQLYLERQAVYVEWRDTVDSIIIEILERNPEMQFERAQFLGHQQGLREHGPLWHQLFDLDNDLHLYSWRAYDIREEREERNAQKVAAVADVITTGGPHEGS